METEKSQDLPFASWSPRKAGGVVQVQTQKPENQRSQLYTSQSKTKGQRMRLTDVQGQEKMDVPAQAEREQIRPSSAFLFYSGPQQIG